MYFKKHSLHGIPALKLFRSQGTWQMTKTVFLAIVSSHPYFLAQCKALPSCQNCYYSVQGTLLFPQVSQLKTHTYSYRMSFACVPSCVFFNATMECKLNTIIMQ